MSTCQGADLPAPSTSESSPYRRAGVPCQCPGDGRRLTATISLLRRCAEWVSPFHSTQRTVRSATMRAQRHLQASISNFDTQYHGTELSRVDAHWPKMTSLRSWTNETYINKSSAIPWLHTDVRWSFWQCFLYFTLKIIEYFIQTFCNEKMAS